MNQEEFEVISVDNGPDNTGDQAANIKIEVLEAIRDYPIDDYEGYVHTNLGRAEYIKCWSELVHDGFIDIETDPSKFLLTIHGNKKLQALKKETRKLSIIRYTKYWLPIVGVLVTLIIAFRDDIWNFIFS